MHINVALFSFTNRMQTGFQGMYEEKGWRLGGGMLFLMDTTLGWIDYGFLSLFMGTVQPPHTVCAFSDLVNGEIVQFMSLL